MDLSGLIRNPEGKTLEFKRDLSSALHVLRTACAFANTAGGLIVIGIEDRTGTVLGIPEPFDAEERLASIVADGISPRLVPDIDVVPWRDTHVIVLRVYPGPSRPYHVKRLGPDSGVFVRVGSTNRQADSMLASELARSARGESYDEQPVPDAGGLDLGAVRETFRGVRAIRSRDLRTLRLTTDTHGVESPTVGGLLLFGHDRLEHFPDAWIQAGRFKGTNKHTIIDSADIRSYLIDGVDHALAFIARNTALAYEFSGARRVDVPEYPPAAVREALVNAVAHADYSQQGAPIRVAIFDDRLEIENPGLLVPGLTIPDLLAGVSKVRNRVIARVFREIGLIEQWGSGVGRMYDACQAAGLLPPLLEEVGTSFRVTLYSARHAVPQVDPLDAAALDALRDGEGLSTSELAARIARTPRAARTRLQRLVERGLVVELGSGPNDPQRRYYIAEDPARYGR